MVLICKSNKDWIWLILHTRICSKERKENSDSNKKYILRPFLINNNGLFSIIVENYIVHTTYLLTYIILAMLIISQIRILK